MYKMRIILLTFFSLFLPLSALAVRAYPYPIVVKEPDGSLIEIVLHGDEFFRYATTVQGNLIIQKDDGFYYYAQRDMLGIKASSSRVAKSPVTFSSFGDSRKEHFFATEVQMIREENMRRAGVISTAGSARPDLGKLTKVLIIPVEFSDLSFTIPDIENHLDRMMNQLGYSEYGGTGCSKEYLESNNPGYKFQLDIAPKITLSKGYEYYGANDDETPSVLIYDLRLEEMIREAVKAAADKIDISEYDNDMDGYIDFIYFLYAGYNEAESGDKKTIWPQFGDYSSKEIRVKNKRVSCIGCNSELMGSTNEIPAGIGSFCHEFSHFLGLKDLYDVNYASDGLAKTLWGKLSIMDTGNYNNNGRTPPAYCAIDRELSGTLSFLFPAKNKTLYLSSIDKSGEAFRIDTQNKNEYFLIECRAESGWDAYIGGSGMIIYHIDKSQNMVNNIRAEVRWEHNLINTTPEHECADLVEAYHSAESISQVFFPGQANITAFTPLTNPSFVSWEGDPVGMRLVDISDYNGEISFKIEQDETEFLLTPLNVKVTPYQTSALVEWDCDRNGSYKWGISWYSEGSKKKESVTRSKKATIEGLAPQTDYTLEIYHIGKNSVGESVSRNFTTAEFTTPYPYIYGIRDSYSVGDTLRLMAQNIPEAVEQTIWHIDERRVHGEEIILNETGVKRLKLTLRYPSDRSEEIITVMIKVENE